MEGQLEKREIVPKERAKREEIMRIVNLMEDTSAKNGCVCEHGLSFYIETKKHKLLVDTGATDAFMENAVRLCVDLKEVDTVILSHGHYDHCGGIMAFAKENPRARIYVRENAFGGFYHVNGEKKRYIGIESGIKDIPGIVKVRDDLKIDDELFLFTNVSFRELWPSGNKELVREVKGRLEQDDFSHEQYLTINCEGIRILVSGCAHNGILNILGRYKDITGKEPDFVISGFHMMKKQGYDPLDGAIILETAKRLADSNIKFYTCHCTGEEPYAMMKKVMGEQIVYVRSGEEINLERTCNGR